MTQCLGELHLDGQTLVGELFFPRRTRLGCQIAVLMEFPADGGVESGRRARIFLVLLLCVLLGAPLVTVVRKSRMALSTATAVWGLSHPTPDMAFFLELVSQDET